MTKNEQLLMTACELAVQHLETQIKEATETKETIKDAMASAKPLGPFWACQSLMDVCGQVWAAKDRVKCPYCGRENVKEITFKEFEEARR